MGVITKMFHNKLIYTRRMKRLTDLIAPLLEDSKHILDVGCGDGKIDSYLLEKNKSITIRGIDVLVRPSVYLDVQKYDGITIPYESDTFDTVMTIDVIHHTDDPKVIVKELVRVSSKYIIIKDHVKSGVISYIKLRAMDYVGNSHYHVRCPYNYQTWKQWKEIFDMNGLEIVKLERNLNLYKGIFHLVFDGKMQFIALLKKK